MSTARQQIEIIKKSYLDNKYDNNILNDIISNIDILKETVVMSELVLVLSQLRKTIIKQIIENDQCNINTYKRHIYTTQTGGRPKKYIDKDALEHMKNIGMSNVDIANVFSVHRNLIARCIKDYQMSIPTFTNHTNEQVINVLTETLQLNSNLGEQYARGILFTNGIRIHQTRLREILRELKGSHPHNIGNPINRRKYKNRSANAAWHHDTTHKLIKYKFVCSGCVDGFSRFIIWLNISNNNKARTSYDCFKQAIQRNICNKSN